MGESRSSAEMSGRLAISASARGMAEDSSSSRQMKKTTKTYVMKTDSQGNVTTHTDVQVSGSGSSESASMRRYEEQIRVLQEDLESEMTLRRRVEHEKQGLQMQIISLSERLTEAESGSESQLDINRKREAEMAKLRKLLEEVHTESEQQIHTLRTKHQTSMMELQDQIESLQSEKVSIKKVVEKLEITVNEYNVKIEGLNKSSQDLNAQKLKLQFEAQEANKKLNDMKLAIEHAGMDKNKFASQMEELRRAADQETRNRNAAETKITSLERNIKTLMVEIEELRQVKINLEGSISKWQAENADWKKKYENEARLRVEEGDALKKKFTMEIT